MIRDKRVLARDVSGGPFRFLVHIGLNVPEFSNEIRPECFRDELRRIASIFAIYLRDLPELVGKTAELSNEERLSPAVELMGYPFDLRCNGLGIYSNLSGKLPDHGMKDSRGLSRLISINPSIFGGICTVKCIYTNSLWKYPDLRIGRYCGPTFATLFAPCGFSLRELFALWFCF